MIGLALALASVSVPGEVDVDVAKATRELAPILSRASLSDCRRIEVHAVRLSTASALAVIGPSSTCNESDEGHDLDDGTLMWSPVVAVRGPDGWSEVAPIAPEAEADTWRLLTVDAVPAQDAVRIELVRLVPGAGKRPARRRAPAGERAAPPRVVRVVTWCSVDADAILCTPSEVDLGPADVNTLVARSVAASTLARVTPDARAIGRDPARPGWVVADPPFALARPTPARSVGIGARGEEGLVALFTRTLGCGLEMPTSGRLASPITLAGGLTLAAASADAPMCPSLELAWRQGGGWNSEGSGDFPPTSTVTLERVVPAEEDPSIALVVATRSTPVHLEAPPPPGREPEPIRCAPWYAPGGEPGADLVIRFVDVVRARDDTLEIARVVTGITLARRDVEGRDAIIDTWERSLRVTPTGLELFRASGRLAFFRAEGRFPWADVETALAREERLMEQVLRAQLERAVAECERTGRLDLMLEGYLEPLFGNMESSLRRAPRAP